MKYKLLGKSGLRVSEAALGTMTFGDEWAWGSRKAEAQKVYETYREVGGNFVDTANFYTNGTSEKFVGEFIQGHRESVVLATKYSLAKPGNDPNAAGTSGMGSRLWKRSCGAWMTSFARERFSTSASRTLPLGGSPRQILWRSFEAGHSSSGCRSNTASWSERSSANFFIWRKP
jgi:aryl-alcohol dehydrogenase-like predicted oxidoreductase